MKNEKMVINEKCIFTLFSSLCFSVILTASSHLRFSFWNYQVLRCSLCWYCFFPNYFRSSIYSVNQHFPWQWSSLSQLLLCHYLEIFLHYPITQSRYIASVVCWLFLFTAFLIWSLQFWKNEVSYNFVVRATLFIALLTLSRPYLKPYMK